MKALGRRLETLLKLLFVGWHSVAATRNDEMKYIFKDADGNVRFEKYFEYLRSVRERLGESLYKFASDPNRYYLSPPESLHDAWLTQLIFQSDVRVEPIRKKAQASYLGPYHDRRFVFEYIDLVDFKGDYDWAKLMRPPDLLTQEFRVGERGIEHECEFEGGRYLEFICKSIEWEEIIL